MPARAVKPSVKKGAGFDGAGVAREGGAGAGRKAARDGAAAEREAARSVGEVERDARHVRAVLSLVREHSVRRLDRTPAPSVQRRVRAPERQQIAVQPEQGSAIGALRSDVGPRRLRPERKPRLHRRSVGPSCREAETRLACVPAHGRAFSVARERRVQCARQGILQAIRRDRHVAHPDLFAGVQIRRSAKRQQHHRRGAGAGVAEHGIVVARRMAGDVVVGEHPRGPALGWTQCFEALDFCAKRRSVPRTAQERKVERQVQLVAAAVVLRHLGGVEEIDLADHHPLAITVEYGAQVAQQPVHIRMVFVVHVKLAAVAGAASGRRGVVAQLRILGDPVHDVDPEAVGPAIEPEAQDVVHGADESRVSPVEIRLFAQERVEIPLAGRRVVLPGRAAEHGHPVVRGLVAASIAPDVPVALRTVAGSAGFEKPRVLVRAVVRNPVQRDADPALVGIPQQLIEILERAEEGIDAAVVGDVVAEVRHRRRLERREPERVDAEPREMVEALPDALEIADPVAVRVLVRARIDLIDDAVLPPESVVAHQRGAFVLPSCRM